MVEYGPNERTGGIMSRLVAEDLKGGSQTGQARTRSLRPWLQIVLACAIPDRLRMLKVVDHPGYCARAIFGLLRLFKAVEDGPLGRTRMNSRVSFDSTTWQGDTVPHKQRQAVPAPWATPGAVPSFFASSC